MSDLNESQQAAVEKAEAEGFTVIHGKPTLLLLDLDTAESREQFRSMFSRVHDELQKRGRDCKVVARWHSKDGGRHVKIRITPGIELASERLVLQAVLGSDLLREMLSLMRIWDGNPEPSMLFKPSAEMKTGADRRNKKTDPFNSELLDDDVPF